MDASRTRHGDPATSTTFPSRTLLAALLFASLPGPGTAQASRAPQPGTLEELGQLMVGTWTAPDSRHVHEWGVGRQTIRSRSYFPSGDGWKLVSEGMWYWDDEIQAIRGTLIAIDMPVSRFEYQTTVSGPVVTHTLRAFGTSGGRYVETWTFAGDGYTWRLQQAEGDGATIMSGSYQREAGG